MPSHAHHSKAMTAPQTQSTVTYCYYGCLFSEQDLICAAEQQPSVSSRPVPVASSRGRGRGRGRGGRGTRGRGGARAGKRGATKATKHIM